MKSTEVAMEVHRGHNSRTKNNGVATEEVHRGHRTRTKNDDVEKKIQITRDRDNGEKKTRRNIKESFMKK